MRRAYQVHEVAIGPSVGDTLVQMASDRGTYGETEKHGGAFTAVVLVGLTAVIYGLSPGARHWYKYGRLPRAEETSQWRR